MPLQIWTHYLLSPDDDIQNEFVAFANQATQALYLNIYGFHLPIVVDVIKAKLKLGVACRGVFDHTQETGHFEHPEVVDLVNAGMDVTIATSPIRHAIDHEKVAIRDPGTPNQAVWFGSWNFSLTATKERNVAVITNVTDIVQYFLAEWNRSHDWAQQNEPQYQLKKGAA